MNKTLRTVALCLLGAAVICGALAQFLPWKTFSFSGFGFSASAHENLWNSDGSFSGGPSGSGGSQSRSYWDSQANDQNGIWLVRIGEILFSLGLVGAIIGGIVLLTGKRAVGGIASVVGGGTGLLAAILLLVGMDQITSSGSSGGPSLDMGFGSFLGIGTALFALAAGIICLLPAAARETSGMPMGAYATTSAPMPAMGAPATAASSGAPAGIRRLKCPRCATVISVSPGSKPACTGCGFGA